MSLLCLKPQRNIKFKNEVEQKYESVIIQLFLTKCFNVHFLP